MTLGDVAPDVDRLLDQADGLLSGLLGETIAVFRRWLHLPDPSPALVVFAAVVANLRAGDPVWLLLVGPPGCGKTELLGPLPSLPNVHPAATFTEAALLSGTPRREAKDAKGGLLREIGDFGILVGKDFGSVLSMHREARASVLAALREIYDGSWTRHVGTDGGKTLHWSGKVGLIAGCTPAIDSHHAVMGSMGERFVIYRLPPTDAAEQARRALTHAGREVEMRSDLARAVQEQFASLDLDATVNFDGAETDRLITLATLAVRCRSAVERDGYSREIELIPEPEAPGRLALVLGRLLEALLVLSVPRRHSWSIIAKVALDSMPAIRRAVLQHLVDDPLPTTAVAVGEALGYPTTTARRTLEDLAAHGLVDRTSGGNGRADAWRLSDWARDHWNRSVPGVSGALFTPPPHERRLFGNGPPPTGKGAE
jgi:hypothetical protein